MELDEARVHVKHRCRQLFRQRQGLGLCVVVAQHQPGHFFGHIRQQFVALFQCQIAGRQRAVEQDFDIDFVIRAIDAAGVVDCIGIDAAAVQCVFDTRRLRQPQIAAFGNRLAAQLAGVDTQVVVGAIVGFAVALAAGLDIGADAAVVEQVDWRLEQLLDQLGRGERLGLDSQCLARFVAELDRFGAARIDAAASGNQFGIVIGPRRARQLEQALAFDKTGCRIGIRIDENMAVVESGQQLDMARLQHAVAEYVARHVANTDNGKILLLDIDADFTEMALGRFPRAARGDRHLFVVVTGRATGGKRVVKPEAIFLRNRIGNIGERSGALVSRDYQVRIVAVEPYHVVRRRNLVAKQVVGQVEQAADEGLVTFDTFRHPGFTLAGRRQLFADETAFGADRHDHRILDHLRLDQPQHLGAEILHPVGPAQAATRHLAAAQMDAFDTRRIDPDFHHRPR